MLTATMMGSCNTTTSSEHVVTIAERDLTRFSENPTPMMQAADILRYLPKFAVAEQRHRRRMGRPAGRFGAVGESGPSRAVRSVPRLVRALGQEPSARRTIAVPCCVMAFEHDIDSPPAFAHVAAAEIPNARYVEIADTSHFAPYTHAADVASVLVEFLRTA